MGEVVSIKERVHADTQETYRLIAAFVQIPDRALREKIVAMAEAGTEGDRIRLGHDPRSDGGPNA